MDERCFMAPALAAGTPIDCASLAGPPNASKISATDCMAADGTKCFALCQHKMLCAARYKTFMPAAPKKAPLLDDPDDRLRWIRRERGFPDAEAAAKRYGWHPGTYRSHENGNRELSRKAAAKYGRAFKVTAGWLLYGEGLMSQPVDPELVTLWDGLTDEQRKALKALVEQMARKVA